MFFSRRNGVRCGGININNIIIGENTEQFAYCWIPIGTHAEIDALFKMRYEFKRKKRFDHMNLIVLRFSNIGKLCYARPCYHCIKQLTQVNFINIKNVYYSETSGHITCEKLANMLSSPRTRISSGYRFRNKLIPTKSKKN